MQENSLSPPLHQKSMEYEISYESFDDQPQIPQMNPINTAIYNKYHTRTIKQQEQQNQQKSSVQQVKFRIKNLDTGEQFQIQNQSQQLMVSDKLSLGRQDINTASQSSWNDFWINVYKNNQKLAQYCKEGLYEQAKLIIQNGQNNYPVQINWKGLDNWSPIHYACYQGNDDIIILLCKNHADINALTKFNRNGLHIAALRGHFDVVKVLVNNNIQINAYDSDGNSALHIAAENGYRDIIVFLIQNGCKIKKNREGKTPISDCCYDYLRKVFYQYGFQQDCEYQQNQYSPVSSSNKMERQILNSNNLSENDFIYYKLLGRGSFGQVYLVQKKDDQSCNLYAMKVLSKSKLETNNLKRYVMTQRNVMSALNHPFMVKLVYAFQSSSKLFLVMEYYSGGDLGKLLQKRKSIPQDQAKKYLCEIILALEALHKNMIIFRDLKPDNVILDSQGHCRLIDFGLSKQGIYNNMTQSFCGSVAYLAPEIVLKQGHSRTVDWYLLGVLMYELIVGLPPYYNARKDILFENIKRGPLKIPKSMSFDAKDLIKKLLSRDPKKRLGAINDSQQIKQHPFFKDVDWQKVFNRKIQMPPIQYVEARLGVPINTYFEQNQNKTGKIQGWTFIKNPS